MGAHRRIIAGASLAAALLAGCASNPVGAPATALPAGVADAGRDPGGDPVGDLIEARAAETDTSKTGTPETGLPETDLPETGEAGAPVAALEPRPAPEPALPEPAASDLFDGSRGALQAYLDRLAAASCPKGARRDEAEAINVAARRVPLQSLNPARKKVGALSYVAGFHLTSPDARFGGLSGIDLLDDGNLLAVSDQGDFIWIDLGEDGVTPVGARIAEMRDAGGERLRGKADGDAEGLAVHNGTALVSFERNHRVLAYDLGRCGAAARGAPTGSGGALARAFKTAGMSVGDNSGAEPLGVTGDWYLFTGLEALAGGAGPLSARPVEAAPEFDLRIGPGAPEFVGLDLLEDGDRVRAFSVHRGADQLLGDAIIIAETDFTREMDQSNLPARIVGEGDERARCRFRITAQRRLAEMSILLTIDNFEGIAAQELEDGTIRLFVVSDDNFSARQRTLLMVFDLPKSG